MTEWISQIGDQLLHMTWAAGTVALVWLSLKLPKAPWWCVPACAGAMWIAFAPRELVDQTADNADTLIDFLGFAVGGGLGGLLPWLLGRSSWKK